jgi:putative ABC transport system substrate-binding protein
MKEATSSTPIVMAAVSDPVQQGIIASLAKPGQNVTGTSSQAEDLLAKRLELVGSLLPNGTTIAVFANARNPVHALGWQRLEAAAQPTSFKLVKVEISRLDDLPTAMDTAMRAHAGALFVLPDDPLMLNIREQLVEIAAKNRIPDFYWAREFVESGGLMSYGENLRRTYIAAAAYMDKIKKGASPATLPVEQPTRFEVVINTKTAKALGLTIPQSLLLRADEVIQ